MIVRVLGTSAGGGCPQWNCACAQCTQLRSRGEVRLQDCVAVDDLLLNASPDLRAQLAYLPADRERAMTVLLTDAELDHTLGLYLLREARSLDVYATSAVLSAVDNGILTSYTTVRWHPVTPGVPFQLNGLTITAFPLGRKRPRYATGDGDWVIGYRIGGFVYAPCFAAWALDSILDGATDALIDGTFLSADEIPGVSGHMPIKESLPYLARHSGVRFRYTHINNTNPALSDGSVPLASDGEEITLPRSAHFPGTRAYSAANTPLFPESAAKEL